MYIIGITGPSASGKGTVVDYLVEKQHYQHFSVSDYLKEQLIAEGKEVNRDTMREIANKLRKEYGGAYIIEQLIQKAKKTDGKVIIESIRALAEVDMLKKYPDCILLSVDASQRLRYERARKRASEKDNISREKFLEQEIAESTNIDSQQQNIPACQKCADYHIVNDGDFDALYSQLEQFLTE